MRFGWLLLLLPACTQPSYTSGQLRCAVSGRACPDDFFCAEGRCFRNGTDLAGPAVVDLGTPDLSGRDQALAHDLATPLDANPVRPPDLGVAPSTCGSLSVGLCDPFESLSRWMTTAQSGCSAGIDTLRSYRGGSAVHFHCGADASPPAQLGALIQTSDDLPVSGTLYLRVWAYFSASFSTAFNQTINFSNANGDGLSYSIQDTQRPVLDDYTAPKKFAVSTTTSIPLGRWVCLQAAVGQSGASGPVTLYLDGAKVGDVSFADVQTPTLTQLILGLDFYGVMGSFPTSDLWLDELIVDTKPTTCDE